MKCQKCGFENKESAAFCTKCGQALEKPKPQPQLSKEKSGMSKYVILAFVAAVVVLAAVSYFGFNGDFQFPLGDDNSNNQSATSDNTTKTQEVKSKSWELIGSYSGSGSGLKTIEVPSGKIKVKLSAYPIKNYDTNHLYVDVQDTASGGVTWNSKSPVETKSDSFEFDSSTSQTATIDYYETESWEVEFYSYQ